MIPILYDSSETLFASNGLGRLRDCIECQVVEERNSVYECNFTYPVTGANFDKIKLGRIIAVKHDDTGDIQPFDIVSYSKPIDGVVSFHAVHISYRQSKLTAVGSNINSLAAAFDMLAAAQPENPFSYSTDIESTAYMAAADGTPRSVRQMLGGVEGSILDAYGGEFEWDKFRVILHKSRGTRRSLAVRYGVNMTEYNEDTDYSSTYTAVLPYWKGGDSIVVGSVVSSGNTPYDGHPNCIPLDLTDKFETQPTAADLDAEAAAYMSARNTHLPSSSVSVSFIQLENSNEYEALAPLLKCKLCDSVRIIFPQYGTSAYMKIVKTVYDVLLERYVSLELGNLSTTLSEALGIETSLDGSGSGGGSGEANDYVTEIGTNSGWAFRKWHSGKVEAWYVGSVTFGGTTAAGSLYYADASLTIPSGIFSSAPEVIASVRSTTGDALNGAVVSVTGLATSGTALTLRDFRVSSATTQHSAKIRLYAWTN